MAEFLVQISQAGTVLITGYALIAMFASYAEYLFLILPLLPVPFLVSKRSRMRRVSEYLKRQIDVPGGGHQFSVEVSVRYNRIKTCEDLGTLTFMGGYVLFEGLRTTFGMRSQDVVIRNRRSTFEADAQLGDNLCLTIQMNPIAELSNAFRAHGPAVGPRVGATHKFRTLWRMWRSMPEKELTYSMYPPVQVYSSRFGQFKRGAFAAVIATALGVTTLIFAEPIQALAVIPVAFAAQILYTTLRYHSLNRYNRTH